MKISKGLATWAGLIGALGSFLLAVATFMDTFDELDPLAGLGPLAAAAGVLYSVIKGRMDQATALAAKPAPAVVAGTTSSGTNVTTAWSSHLSTTAEPPEEPGDRDALPDYLTETDPPADQGDTSANGDAGERES